MSALTSLQGWWRGLGPRDQRALRLGGLVLLVSAPLLVGWSIHDLLAGRRAALEESRLLAATASQRVASRLGGGGDLAASAGDVSAALQSRVARGVERAGLTPNVVTTQATAPGRLQLVLRDASGDSLVTLLGALARWEGITVVSAEITRSRPGRVEATLLLRGP